MLIQASLSTFTRQLLPSIGYCLHFFNYFSCFRGHVSLAIQNDSDLYLDAKTFALTLVKLVNTERESDRTITCTTKDCYSLANQLAGTNNTPRINEKLMMKHNPHARVLHMLPLSFTYFSSLTNFILSKLMVTNERLGSRTREPSDAASMIKCEHCS